MEEEEDDDKPAEPLNLFERVSDPGDPRRCQGVTPKGQCWLVKMPGSEFCTAHAGCGNATARKASVKNYRLTKYRARVEEFADSDAVKSLREEVGILRLLLEETVNRCENETDLILYSNKISDLVEKVNKLVTSCHKLEAQTGMLMDKTMALKMASDIATIVAKYVSDENVLDAIATEIIDSIANIRKEEADK